MRYGDERDWSKGRRQATRFLVFAIPATLAGVVGWLGREYVFKGSGHPVSWFAFGVSSLVVLTGLLYYAFGVNIFRGTPLDHEADPPPKGGGTGKRPRPRSSR
jgi:hypothetical protein